MFPVGSNDFSPTEGSGDALTSDVKQLKTDIFSYCIICHLGLHQLATMDWLVSWLPVHKEISYHSGPLFLQVIHRKLSLRCPKPKTTFIRPYGLVQYKVLPWHWPFVYFFPFPNYLNWNTRSNFDYTCDLITWRSSWTNLNTTLESLVLYSVWCNSWLMSQKADCENS